LNPYLNFHRPCFFPETRTEHKGKQRKIYRYENMVTPYDKLKSLPSASNGTNLRPFGTVYQSVSSVTTRIYEKMLHAEKLNLVPFPSASNYLTQVSGFKIA
jgi:hypothetical protein